MRKKRNIFVPSVATSQARKDFANNTSLMFTWGGGLNVINVIIPLSLRVNSTIMLESNTWDCDTLVVNVTNLIILKKI